MLFSKALYYPTIDIRNDRWLKSAVLFWDKIETIVPQSKMERPYENSTARVLYENDFLIPHIVNPFSEDVVELEDDVRRYVDTKEGKKLLCHRWYNVSRAQMRGDGFYDRQRARDAFLNDWRKRNREKFGDFFIHIEKLPHFLQDELQVYADENGFVASTPEFLEYYMTLLANNICRRHNLSLLTDRMIVNNLSNKILKDKAGIEVPVKTDPQNLQCILYRIIIDNILINPTTPIVKIVEFKNRYRDELSRFRQEVSRLTIIDSNLTTLDAVTDQVREIYENSVVPSVNDLKRALDGASIKWILDNAYSYMVSSLAPATLNLAGLPLSRSIPVSAGLAVGYTALGAWQAKKDIMRNSPYSYLIRANRKFSIIGWK